MEEFVMREVSSYTFKHYNTILKLDSTVERETISINEKGVITLTLWVHAIPFDFMRLLAIGNEHLQFQGWSVTKETLVRVLSCGADIGHDLQIENAIITFSHDSQWSEENDPPRSIIKICGNIRGEKLDDETLQTIKNKTETLLKEIRSNDES